jgi:hypothetical protein
VEQWTILDDDYAAGEFRLQLHGWRAERRFVVLRERVREDRDSVGRSTNGGLNTFTYPRRQPEH